MNLDATSLDLSQISVSSTVQRSGALCDSRWQGLEPTVALTGLSSLPLTAFQLALPDSLPLISPHIAPNLSSPPLAPGSVSASCSLPLLLLFLVLRDCP